MVELMLTVLFVRPQVSLGSDDHEGRTESQAQLIRVQWTVNETINHNRVLPGLSGIGMSESIGT